MSRCAAVAIAVAIALGACRVSLDSEPEAVAVERRCAVSTAATCTAAVDHSDLTWIQANVFQPSCAFSDCHDGKTAGIKLDLSTAAQSHSHLVNVTSNLEAARKLVVPGDLAASYLLLLVGDVPADMADPPGAVPPVGYMPQGAAALCCQKLDALERWIADGAQTN